MQFYSNFKVSDVGSSATGNEHATKENEEGEEESEEQNDDGEESEGDEKTDNEENYMSSPHYAVVFFVLI